MDIDDLSEIIIGAAIEVHRCVGPGLLESVYEECLAKELDSLKIKYERQKSVPINYKGSILQNSFKLDFIVENTIILELKSLNEVPQVCYSQLITYLRLLDRQVGLLINFNVPLLKDGIRRVVNNYKLQTIPSKAESDLW